MGGTRSSMDQTGKATETLLQGGARTLCIGERRDAGQRVWRHAMPPSVARCACSAGVSACHRSCKVGVSIAALLQLLVALHHPAPVAAACIAGSCGEYRGAGTDAMIQPSSAVDGKEYRVKP